jgi:hypothetical protein
MKRATGKWTVYSLLLRGAERPFYVGQTGSPLHVRLKGHISSVSRSSSPISRYLRTTPRESVLIRAEESAGSLAEAVELEKKWIRHYMAEGATLQNVRRAQVSCCPNCGEPLFSRELSQEQRRKAIARTQRWRATRKAQQ